ncbi:predicted protein [Verticillium alfalfae VaMs.102]|uniref:Predicted protein n=1 Tax=Verticillium alfalfae (strain VaMs.102 / ATCC MYA-4576 / FGSC 10136) TaxID=526221 RepID=C9SDN8_VERA1|nr:predicted protein [Verticillium alfalfae VaMs.102]EEY17158.1 predicted protein [Verticillium alfalfae VaMs.102]
MSGFGLVKIDSDVASLAAARNRTPSLQTHPSCGLCGEYLPAAEAAGEEKALLSRAPSTKKESVNQTVVLTAPIGFSHGCSVAPFSPIVSIRHVASISHRSQSSQATMNPSLLVLVAPPKHLRIVASVSHKKAEVPVQMSALWLISTCPRPAKFRAAYLHTPSLKTFLNQCDIVCDRCAGTPS